MDKIGKFYDLDCSYREGRYFAVLAERYRQNGESPDWMNSCGNSPEEKRVKLNQRQKPQKGGWVQQGGKDRLKVIESSVLQLLLVHGGYLGLYLWFAVPRSRQGMSLGVSLFIVGAPLTEAEQHGNQLDSRKK